MSIFSSYAGLDHEHDEDCAVWIECSDQVFEIGDPKDCTCGTPWAPLAYAGSHVLPSDDDPKADLAIEMACIPAHITRDGRDDAPEGAPKPWLRFGVYNQDSDLTCILTRRQVERLTENLQSWVKQFPAERGEMK